MTSRGKPLSFDTTTLRKEAEAWLKAREGHFEVDGREPMELVSELMVHQAELELQNQQLRDAQEALEVAKNRYFTLFDLAPVAYFIIGQQHTIDELNLAAAELLGTERSRIRGRPLTLFFDQADRERLYAHLSAALTGDRKQVADLRLRLRGPAGQGVRHVHLESQRLRGELGASPPCLVACLDMTELRRAEESQRELELRLRDAQRYESLSALAGGMAQDFDGLLSVILEHVGLARTRLSQGEVGGAELQRIAAAAQRASDLCRQMLPHPGVGRFATDAVDVGALVREAARTVETAPTQQPELRLELAPDLPRVLADRMQLRQLVTDLLGGAVEAARGPAGRIALRTGTVVTDRAYLESVPLAPNLAEGTYVYLEIEHNGRDVGGGGQDWSAPPLFPTRDGAGLSLVAASGLARNLGGAVRVDEQGSKVRVLLPIAPRASISAAQYSGPDLSARGRGRVLVVEDNARVRRVMAEVLERLGWETLAAASGPEAIGLFRQSAQDFAAVLLDVSIAGMDGESVFQELCRIRPDVAIIVTSGHTGDEFASHYTDCKPAAFLARPLQLDELARVLASVARPRS